MDIEGKAKLLRIFMSSTDKVNNTPLYEFVVYAARRYGLAGATVLRGVMGYGASSMVHSVKILAISDDLPVIVEIVDNEYKIDDFVTTIQKYLDNLKSGVLVTSENINIIHYSPAKQSNK